jgi:hypothetical protein
MSVDELYLIEEIMTGEERHLESGDNPSEKRKKHTSESEDDDEGDRDLESGDNPAERRRNS